MMHKLLGCGSAACCGGKCVDKALLVLRVVAGIIFILHGWGKVFGTGPAALGMAKFSGYLTTLQVPAPEFFAWVVALVELVGGLALLVGILVRPASVLLAINMAVAFLLASKAQLPKGDLELSLFAIVIALALVGSGAYALMPGKQEMPATSKH
jgi:putative oxidoreductase